MEDCLFCKIIKGEIPSTKVYEDEKCLAFLDINPINKGHVLVIPKEHTKDLYDISEDSLKAISVVAQKVAKAVKKATGAQGVNLGMNNESAAGQVIFHAHFHVIPRFPGDGHEHWKGTPYPEEAEKESIGENIRKAL